MKKWLLLAALSVMMVLSAAAAQSVTVFGAFTDASEVDAVNAGFAQLEEQTGIDIVYEGASDFEILVNTRIEAGDPPDIACFPQPGLMNRFSDRIVDVTSFIPRETLEERYLPGLVDIATAYDGSDKVLGVWMRVVVKSLVWYSPQMFDDFRLRSPRNLGRTRRPCPTRSSPTAACPGACRWSPARRPVGSAPTGSKTSCCARLRSRTTTPLPCPPPPRSA